MKELSIEQKAKRYDEAKFIMEKYLKSGNAGVIAENTIKKAFPELKESEDNRIRKELISFLKSPFVNKNITDEKVTPWISWLEKQSEQKTTEWSEEDEKQWNNIWDVLDGRFELSEEGYKNAANWFKSLKDRYTWKPSDQQVLAIHTAIGVVGKYTYTGSYLQEVLEQVKKLRGE